MAYIQRRLKLFQQLQLDPQRALPQPIRVNGTLYAEPVTPYQLGIKTMLASLKLTDECCPHHIYDIHRPLTQSCTINALDFDQDSFWHSSAHVLGYAIELNYPDAKLAHGPSTDQGFFYDFGTSQKVTELDYDQLANDISKIVKSKYRFERLECSKEQALDLFQDNKYKQEFIQTKVQGATSVYRIGDFVDLCTGPHIAHTGYCKAFKVLKHSSSYWQGDATKDSLQRIYAISFQENQQLKNFVHQREEALKRDHRELGQKQELFFWNTRYSPGSAFFLPHGTVIYNKLVQLMRSEYKLRGFQEVITPNVFGIDLWKVSGHYKNYKDDLFLLPSSDPGGQWQGLKPMNCPGHCLIFANKTQSYRDLPLKIADFGVLHRNELTGALSGLTRVRRFQQDDAHIFCKSDQIEDQISECLSFLDSIYGLFGFEYEIKLATRPAVSMGSQELWDQAENQLKTALAKSGKQFGVKEGDGAFYGPKIDIQIKDALGRAIQCGTIQLDFQLPIRFNLQYSTGQDTIESDIVLQSELFPVDEYSTEPFEWKEMPLKPGCARPVMIHRAILGSVERFIALLTEHLSAKWPLWLSPRQVCIVPINDQQMGYCQTVFESLKRQGFEVFLDDSAGSLNKKVRNAQLLQFNYIAVIGDQEASEQVLDIRARDGTRMGKQSVDSFVQIMLKDYPANVPKPC